MLFRIKFISDEVDGFVREIKIDSDATFLDLNKAILESCGYPDDQMTCFFLCDEEWKRELQITREDMGVGSADEDIYVMEDTRLSEFIEDEEQHLEFVFDPFEERCFYLDVKEIIPGETLKYYDITRAKGEAPKQIMDMNMDLSLNDSPKNKKRKAAPAEEDDFENDALYEGAAFNDDEIDLEGFEISEGQPY